MAKRKSAKSDRDEKKSFWVTLPGILTAITALITAIAGLIAAINTSAELFNVDVTPSPIPPSSTVVPVNTPAIVATITPTESPTPIPPPVFTTRDLLYSEEDPYWPVEQVEFKFESGKFSPDTIQDFLRLSRIAIVEFEEPGVGFDIQFILHNTGNQPIFLDLAQRFFSMVDDQGRSAELIYFCCASKGEILEAGRERTIQLFFLAKDDWYGKGISANYIDIRVDGLLPIVSAVWQMPALATAE